MNRFPLHWHAFGPAHSRAATAGFLAVLFFLVACTQVQIPTADQTPTVAQPATVAQTAPVPSPQPAVTASQAAEPAVAPTVAVNATATSLPEGGSIAIGLVGTTTAFDVNAMPAFLQSALYDSLLRSNPSTGALEPGLAESFQVSPDATTMTFRLRQGVRFHNGEPLTANDVVATLTAFSSPNFRGTPVTDFGTFVRATAVDERTVQLSFKEAYCSALTSIGVLKILPRALVTAANFPQLKPEQLIGTGPLQVQSNSGDKLTLVRNPAYALGSVGIDTWTVRFFSDAAAMQKAFSAKQVDVLAASPREYAAIKKLAGATVVSSAAPEMVTLLFNFDHIALNDARVRHALNYALDRNVLLGDVAGQGMLLDATGLPGFWARPAQIPRFTFDVGRAKQLLGEAGWRAGGDGVLSKDGRPLALELWTEADDPVLEPLAFRIREMYAALGIQVTLQLDDRPGWITHAFDHRFDLLLISRKLPLDPDERWYWQSDQNTEGSGFNFGSYSSAKTDALYRELMRVNACAPQGRATLFGELERNLILDAPAVFLLAPTKYVVRQDRVAGPAPSTFAGDFWNLPAWRVKP